MHPRYRNVENVMKELKIHRNYYNRYTETYKQTGNAKNKKILAGKWALLTAK